jgi:hypothetical protein
VLPAIEAAAEQRTPFINGASRSSQINARAFGISGQRENLLARFAIRQNLNLIRLHIVALFRMKQKKLFTAATLGAAVTRNRRQLLF